MATRTIIIRRRKLNMVKSTRELVPSEEELAVAAAVQLARGILPRGALRSY